jgi:hypothetical protein
MGLEGRRRKPLLFIKRNAAGGIKLFKQVGRFPPTTRVPSSRTQNTLARSC